MTIKEFKIQYALGTLSYDMRYELAKDKKTPKEILTILSTDKNRHVRYWVAENPNTPKEVLKVLSTDWNMGVRWWAARNPNAPKEVVEKLW